MNVFEVVDSSELNIDDNVLVVLTVNGLNKYDHRQFSIERPINVGDQTLWTWGSGVGVKKILDPEYVRYLELRKKFEGV